MTIKMKYQEFAPWYDVVNIYADYDKYANELMKIFWQYQGLKQGTLVDLGCGTGELTLRLAKAGYEMIAVDASETMLAQLQHKVAEIPAIDVLLLQQNLESLDLFGTVDGAISTFDTLNHLPPSIIDETLAKAALFIEPGGLFVFDMNTPYKHRCILNNNTFTIKNDEGVTCVWNNRYDKANNPNHAVKIEVEILVDDKPAGTESFYEYAYSQEDWQKKLNKHGFEILHQKDGDTFEEVKDTSERILYITKRNATVIK